MSIKSNSNNTKMQALDVARGYLQTVGYGGFSFQTIADSLGIKKASLHYYFASKEDMGIALLKEYEDNHKAWAQKVALLPSRVKLEKMVKGFKSLSSKNHMICPIGSFITEFQAATPKMKKKIKQFHFIVRDWLVETMEQGKKEGTIKKSLDTQVAADLFLATLQGSVQVARIRGEEASLNKMLELMLENFYGK